MALKVLFRGFWPGFSPDKSVGKFFIEILNEIYKETVVIPTSTFQDADLLFDSCFNGSAIQWKNWHNNTDKRPKTFFFSGESYALPNWKDYDVAFWGESPSKSSTIVPLPLFPLYLLDLGEPPHIVERLIPPNDVLVIISNPDGFMRNRFLEELSKSDLQITYAGKYKNNIGGPLIYSFGTPEFAAFASKYKFIISMENSQQENYITEKVLQGLFAETIPVYYGAPCISNYINKERIIIFEEESGISNIIKKMLFLKTNPEAWLETVRQPWEGPLTASLTPTCLAEKCIALRK